jgi:hypothetical protein
VGDVHGHLAVKQPLGGRHIDLALPRADDDGSDAIADQIADGAGDADEPGLMQF